MHAICALLICYSSFQACEIKDELYRLSLHDGESWPQIKMMQVLQCFDYIIIISFIIQFISSSSIIILPCTISVPYISKLCDRRPHWIYCMENFLSEETHTQNGTFI